MKKNIIIMMTIFLITGCGKKVDLTKIKDEMSKKDNYQMDINVKGYGIKQDITIKKINDKNYEIIVNDLNKKAGKKLIDNTSLKDIELDKVSTFIYVNNDNTIYQMEFKLNDKSTIKVNYSRYENTTLYDELDITNSKFPVIGD